MPTVPSSRVVESGPGGQVLAMGAWQKLEALPDRAPERRIYPLACLIAIALCACAAVGSRSAGPASKTWPGCAPRGTRCWPLPVAG